MLVNPGPGHLRHTSFFLVFSSSLLISFEMTASTTMLLPFKDAAAIDVYSSDFFKVIDVMEEEFQKWSLSLH